MMMRRVDPPAHMNCHTHEPASSLTHSSVHIRKVDPGSRPAYHRRGMFLPLRPVILPLVHRDSLQSPRFAEHTRDNSRRVLEFSGSRASLSSAGKATKAGRFEAARERHWVSEHRCTVAKTYWYSVLLCCVMAEFHPATSARCIRKRLSLVSDR